MRQLIPAVLLVLLACKGDQQPSGPPPTITISAGASTSSVVAGSPAVQVALTLTRSANATSPADLSVSGAPAGVTATITPAQLTAGATTASLSIGAAAGAAAGASLLTIAARSGSLTATATLALTVQPAPDFSFALDSVAVGVPLSSARTLGLRVTRSGSFVGDVGFNVAGLPNGVTATFSANPIPATATTSTVTITANGAVPAGAYPVTVTATGQGVGSRTQSLALSVVQSGAVSVHVQDPTTALFAGRSLDLPVIVRRTAPFAGPVTLSPPASNADATFALSRAVIPAGDSTAVLTVKAGLGVAASTPIYQVKANGIGVSEAAGSFAVAFAPLPATFDIAQDPMQGLDLIAGGAGSTRLEVVRAVGFAATLSFTVSTAPAGITASFSPATGVLDSTRLHVSVAPSTPPGEYRIDWLADGGGGRKLGAQSLVRVAPRPAGQASFKLCDPTNPPLLFAVRDDGGPWRSVAASGGFYSFVAGTPRISVAQVYRASTSVVAVVRHLMRDELDNAATIDCDQMIGPFLQVSGTIRGRAATEAVVLSAGLGNSNLADTFSSGASGLAPATLRFARITGGVFGGVLRDVILRRDLSVGQMTPLSTPLDFASAEPIPAVPFTLTIGNLGADSVFMTSRLVTATHPRLLAGSTGYVFGGGNEAGAIQTAYGLQAARLLGTDLQAIEAGAVSGPQVFRYAARTYRTIGNMSVTLPPVSDTPVLAWEGPESALRPRISGSLTGTGARLLYTQVRQPFAGGGNWIVILSASTAWLGGDNYDIAFPDLSALPGWNPAWVFRRAVAGSLFHSVYGSSQATVHSFPTEGSTWTRVVRNGAMVP